MADWRQWIEMAAGSLEAADFLEDYDKESFVRSAASRYYYAAYQAMTALLLYEGQTPPIVGEVERESWSHEITPEMVLQNLGRIVPDRKKRYQLRSNLQELYKTRVYADYSGTYGVNRERLKTARKLTRYLVKVAQRIVSAEETVA
jgi:hypothetical protein